MAYDPAIIRREAKIELYRRDFPRFFYEQCQIRPAEGPVVHAELKRTQKLVDHAIEQQLKERGYVRICEYKARQHGGSTHGVGRGAHRAFLNENTRILVVAQDDSTAANLFDMAQLMYESMDEDIRPVRRYLNKSEIVLENPDVKTRPDFPGLRSSLRIRSQRNIHAGVGTTPNWLHLSEVARYSRMNEFKGSILPAIHMVPGTGILYESAPFGYGEGRDEFRAMCDSARSGKSDFAFVGIYWWMDPQCTLRLLKGQNIKRNREERALMTEVSKVARKELGITNFELSDEQLNYRRARIETFGNGDPLIGEQLFMQQYPHNYDSGWVTMDLRVFNGLLLEETCRETVKPPLAYYEIDWNSMQILKTPDNSGPLWVWENPIPGEQYDLGADGATGTGGDYSAIQVIKRRTKEQVAEYKRWVEPLDFSRVIRALGQWYNWAHVACELEGIGYAINEDLGRDGYPNIYQWRERNHMGGVRLTNLTGWKTQINTKPLLVATIQDYLAHKRLIIRSIRLRDEMRRFIKMYTDSGNVTYGAAEGNDDCIMSFMIGLQAAKDEEALDMPAELGGIVEPTNSKEREAVLKRYMETGQPAVNDLAVLPDSFGSSRRNDPWQALARAVRHRDEDFA